VKRSTWRLLRESGFGLRALHGYAYLRWSRAYVRTLMRMGARGPSPAFGRWLADRYHGKVLPHDHACELVSLDHDVAVTLREQVVPYPMARDIVLESPPDVVAYECSCRHNRPVHCEPTRVCMIIGRPMTDFVLEHHPRDARRLTTEEALELLAEEHARGHVHTAYFKDATLNRFYAICNCCRCCCAGIQAMVEWGIPVLASSGSVAEIDAAVCARCGECVGVCAFRALSVGEDGVVRDWEKCMGCGACEARCAAGAVKLVRDAKKGEPLDARALRG
jgi:NAD-dependent dihydropyrimidine dehydrogenase PreA subunit